MREIYEFYNGYGSTIPGGFNDKIPIANIDAEAAGWANARLNTYQTELGATGIYVGLQPFSPDGAITQVTWELGAGGTYTTVSRIAEVHPYLPPMKRRRVADMQRQQRQAKGGNVRGRE